MPPPLKALREALRVKNAFLFYKTNSLIKWTDIGPCRYCGPGHETVY